MLRQVSGIGNNLNQIARYLNQHGLPPQERVSLLAVLNSIDQHLAELLEQHRDR
ncbi:MAG: MobC family plasmid mobilization relaxosome protein [Plesiomonas shigelloides]